MLLCALTVVATISLVVVSFQLNELINLEHNHSQTLALIGREPDANFRVLYCAELVLIHHASPAQARSFAPAVLGLPADFCAGVKYH